MFEPAASNNQYKKKKQQHRMSFSSKTWNRRINVTAMKLLLNP